MTPAEPNSSATSRSTPALSLQDARQIALRSQGFGGLPAGAVTAREIDAVVHRLRVLQIDSVNVFERSHYLPVFARLGSYSRTELDRLAFGDSDSPPEYTEYWAHEAALLPREDWPLWRWKMRRLRERDLGKAEGWAAANSGMLDWLRAELRQKGPVRSSQIEHDANTRKGGWWEWSDVKRGLEYLFDWGEVVPAGRTRFQRIYGLSEDVLPASLRSQEISEHDALRTLLSRAAQALGIGSFSDIADYFRIPNAHAIPVLHELVEVGELNAVSVDGWTRAGKPVQVFVHRAAPPPGSITAAAVLSPFDPVVWDRNRALGLFDFHYRIEIYTPAAKRQFGYYSLPILLDDELVGRIDLKSDRKAGLLLVPSAWIEDGSNGRLAEVAERVAEIVTSAAAWQGLGGVRVTDWGDLARELAGALGVRLHPRTV